MWSNNDIEVKMSERLSFYKSCWNALKYGLNKETNILLRGYTFVWLIWASIISLVLIINPPDASISGVENFIASIIVFVLFVILPFMPITWIWKRKFLNSKHSSIDNTIAEIEEKIPSSSKLYLSETASNSKPIVNPILEPDVISPINQETKIGILTAFSYKGATIQYKVKVENPTSEPIADIKVILYVPDVFLLSASNKNIGMLKPDEGKTVTFNIRPTGECGDCEISGKVVYYDYFAKKTSETEIPAKSLSIVCPMLHGKEINETEWHGSVSNLVKAEESTRDIDMSAESLFTMLSRIVKDMHMYAINPEITQNEQLFNGVARFYGEGVKGLRYAAEIEVIGGSKKSKLILKTWAEKEEALTGFYHGVLDEIEKRVNVKEYIDNSIAQQYNIHYGDKIGAQVKDSVVQRSNIGTDTKIKCPDCGKEAGENEKFCNECGVKLE